MGNNGTSTRAAIYDYMLRYQTAHNTPPTVREVCEAVNTVPSQVVYHLGIMQKIGIVEKTEGASRCYKAVE